MKLVHMSFHFEFAEMIEAVLDRQEIGVWARYPMVEGKDADGKHYGTKVFPGALSVVQALVEDEKVENLLDALRGFKEKKGAHGHLEALVLPVERRL